MDDKKPMTEEEEADEIVRRLATHPPSPQEEFRRIMMPMIRRIIPTTIANEIIGVQPMTGPIADIKTMRYLYGREKDSDDTGRGS